jgi:hypothetical protein
MADVKEELLYLIEAAATATDRLRKLVRHLLGSGRPSMLLWIVSSCALRPCPTRESHRMLSARMTQA